MAVETLDRQQSAAAAYEHSGPTLLAAQPLAPDIKEVSPQTKQRWQQLRSKLEGRLNALKTWRVSWWAHWVLLAKFLMPRHFIWFSGSGQPAPNVTVRGEPVNQAIIDATGTRAMHVCAAGLMNGLSSPSRPWFKWSILIAGREPTEEEKVYFDLVEERMYTVLNGSNFYSAWAQQKDDLVLFGQGPVVIYEDDEDVIRCYNMVAGEYFLVSSGSGRVGGIYRLFLQTVAEMVDMFEVANCPPEVRQLWKEGGSALEREFVTAHAIEPNFPVEGRDGEEIEWVSADYPWREIYWVYGVSSDMPLSARGFHEQPFVCPRWRVTGNNAYGDSLAMDVLPDVMQLQQESIRKAEALDKMVRPPMLASADLKNQPSSALPGDITYVATLNPGTGMRPMYEVTPPIQEIAADIASVQERIQSGFFNDIFLMISETSQGEKTAYQVAKEYEEKLQMLGPFIERQQSEGDGPALRRIFRIMERKRLLPPMPKSLVGIPIGVEFVSIVALAQKAVKTGEIEQFIAAGGNMRAVWPEVVDNVDPDMTYRLYGEELGVDARVFRPMQAVMALRQQRAQLEQQQRASEVGQTLVQGAQTLSQTDVGGGRNALEWMLNGGGGAA